MPETCSFMTTALSGRELLVDPQLNKGTAFSETERCTFDLHGLLTLNVRRIADRRALAHRGLSRRIGPKGVIPASVADGSGISPLPDMPFGRRFSLQLRATRFSFTEKDLGSGPDATLPAMVV